MTAQITDPSTRIFVLEEANAKLLAALECLAAAVPPQSNDRDWWPDDLTDAVASAKSLVERYA